MKWNLWTVLSIKVKFEYSGNVYAACWHWREGFEIVLLDGDSDRPFVVAVVYSGLDMRAARDAIKALGG